MPMIPSRYSATWKIGQFLNRLLRPFVARIIQSRSFVDEADLIQKLNAYALTQHRLRANTLFCTLKITNFHTLASHTSMLETMGYFLQDNLATPKLGHLSTATIQNLLQLFLYNNIFCYKNTIYTMIRGGPNTMPSSDTLSNMYLFEWQQIIGKAVGQSDEIFGRLVLEVIRRALFFSQMQRSTVLHLERLERNLACPFASDHGTASPCSSPDLDWVKCAILECLHRESEWSTLHACVSRSRDARLHVALC